MTPVKLGVVGCGVIGPTHMKAAAESELIELVAVADLIEERAHKAAADFDVPKTYIEGADLLDDPDVEAVVLAFPAQHRTELALQAFARGKHVLTEKPVAMNAGEVKQMLEARGDLTAACCSSRFRFLAGAETAAEFVASGALGELRVVRCRHIVPCGEKPDQPRPDWRLKKELNAGGILCNWGCYDLDYLLGLCGWQLRPTTAFAQTWTIPPRFESHIWEGSNAETYYTALVRCEGGTMISVERGEFMPAQGDEAWQIVGTEGSLKLRMVTGNPKEIIHDDTTTEQGVVSRTLWEGDEEGGPMTAGPVQDFAAAIREGTEPSTSLERALVVQQITDAIYASAERATSVEIR